MSTAFDPSVRLLACDGCGAPLEAATGAVDLVCSYCDAHNQLALPARPLPGTAIDAREQQRRLGEQMHRPRPMSPSVAEFVDGDRLAPWREGEALAAWIEGRRLIRAGGADIDRETQFFELTRLLAEAARRAGDDLRERALLESGYEASPLPRRRTYFAAALGQRAALTGDLEAARAWIERGDRTVDDLEAFSALTLARGLAARVAGQPGEVLDALGPPGRELPTSDDDAALAAVLRADALERLLRTEEAAAVLERAAIARWPRSRAEVVLARERLGDVCPGSFPIFEERRGSAKRRKDRYNIVVLSGFLCLYGGGAAWSVVLALTSRPWWGLVAVLGALPAGLMLWALVDLLRSRDRWRRPLWGTVREVEPPSGDSSGHATVAIDGVERPVLIGISTREVVERGMRALLLPRSAFESVRFLD